MRFHDSQQIPRHAVDGVNRLTVRRRHFRNRMKDLIQNRVRIQNPDGLVGQGGDWFGGVVRVASCELRVARGGCFRFRLRCRLRVASCELRVARGVCFRFRFRRRLWRWLLLSQLLIANCILVFSLWSVVRQGRFLIGRGLLRIWHVRKQNRFLFTSLARVRVKQGLVFFHGSIEGELKMAISNELRVSSYELQEYAKRLTKFSRYSLLATFLSP